MKYLLLLALALSTTSRADDFESIRRIIVEVSITSCMRTLDMLMYNPNFKKEMRRTLGIVKGDTLNKINEKTVFFCAQIPYKIGY
jgi:hypothetical protein